MFNFDQQFQLAATMAKSFTDATATAMQASTTFWSQPKTPDPGRSWYRPPAAPNPFDWSTWTMPPSSSALPWTAWSATFNPMAMPMMPAGSPPWSAIAAFASAMAAMQPAQSYWTSMMPATQPANPSAAIWWQSLMWPMAQFSALAAAAPTDFASYRSTGGHATAQITYATPQKSDWRSTNLH